MTVYESAQTLRFCPLRRGYTLEVTPVPIPNTAVKLQRADDTSWHTGGKVGRRDVKPKPPAHAGGFSRSGRGDRLGPPSLHRVLGGGVDRQLEQVGPRVVPHHVQVEAGPGDVPRIQVGGEHGLLAEGRAPPPIFLDHQEG